MWTQGGKKRRSGWGRDHRPPPRSEWVTPSIKVTAVSNFSLQCYGLPNSHFPSLNDSPSSFLWNLKHAPNFWNESLIRTGGFADICTRGEADETTQEEEKSVKKNVNVWLTSVRKCGNANNLDKKLMPSDRLSSAPVHVLHYAHSVRFPLGPTYTAKIDI